MPSSQARRLFYIAALVSAAGVGLLFLVRQYTGIQLPPNPVFGGCARDPTGLLPPGGPEGRQANYLHTCGNRIYDSQGRQVKIAGLNWYGMESFGNAPEGLHVRHQPTSAGRTPLWYTREIPEERWIGDWVMLARRYYGNDTVIGVDLHNEPRGPATWGSGDPVTDWRLAAERAGNAVLEVNPYLLVFVEGIENYNGDHYWWGGDLQGVRSAPVRLRVPNRVAYSPHDYGPNVSGQAWFWDPLFPQNLPAEWDRRWGYIQQGGTAPVVLGEFGGYSVGDDPEGQWQTTLLAYLKKNDIGALVWALNPSWDAGGVLDTDWKTIESEKQPAYMQILAPPV